MKLERLTIERLPGIGQTLEVHLPADRASVIIGANASGKSSLIRALKTLLDRKPKNAPVVISAAFERNGRRIEGSALGAARSWRIDGAEAERPDWPDAEQLDAYLIRADDLVDPGQTEQQIAAAIKQTLAGGIDLDDLLESPPFKPTPRPVGLKRKLDELDQKILALENRYAALTVDFDGLAALRARHRQSAEAERRLNLLERALEWLSVRRRIEATQSALDRMPTGMERIRGHEAEDLQALRQERADKQQRLDSNQSRQRQAQDELDQLQIDDIEQTQAWRDDLAAVHSHLQEAETRLAHLKEQRAAAQARLEHAADRAGGLEAAAVQSLSPEVLRQIETAIVHVQTATMQADDLRAEIDWRSRHAADPEESLSVDQAINHLRDWLALPPSASTAWWLWSLLLIAAAGSSTWLWLNQQIWPAALCAISALLPLSHLIGLGLRALRSGRLKNRYQALNLEMPARWRTLETQKRLKQLERQQADLERQRSDLDSAEALNAQLQQLQQDIGQQQRRIARMAADCGLKPEVVTEASAALRLRALHDWQQADAALHELDARIKTVQATINGLLGTAANCLNKLQPASLKPPGLIMLEGELERVDRKLSQARELRERMRATGHAIEQIRADIQTLHGRHRRLFDQAGLTPDDDDALHQRLDCLQEYRQQSEQLRALQVSAQQHQSALQSEPDLVELALSQNEQGLTALQFDLQQQAGQRDEIKEQISNIENRYSDAMQRRELEQLISERESVRDQLNEALNRHRMATAGQFLLERVRNVQHRRHQPALLKGAMRWFGRFTHARYALKFEGGHFSAWDSQLGQPRGLAELSTATRVQLKLALRLAWIDQIDAHRPGLPVFLDEVLATSDPDRYRAVVEAAQELVRNGRQVVYLSAQPVDAIAWQGFAGQPEPEIIRFTGPQAEQAMTFTLPEMPVCPDAALSPAEWAEQARVHAIDPWQSAQSIELFHVFRDRLEQLNTWRKQGIQRLGELRHAIELNLIEPDTELQRRIAGTQAWIERWRSGRTRPLSAAALAESGVISENYLEAVAAVCRHVGGDARELLHQLNDGPAECRVAGFGPKKIATLEDWLSASGYLDHPKPTQAFELIDCLTQHGPMNEEQAADLHRWLTAGLSAGIDDREHQSVIR